MVIGLLSAGCLLCALPAGWFLGRILCRRKDAMESGLTAFTDRLGTRVLTHSDAQQVSILTHWARRL